MRQVTKNKANRSLGIFQQLGSGSPKQNPGPTAPGLGLWRRYYCPGRMGQPVRSVPSRWPVPELSGGSCLSAGPRSVSLCSRRPSW